MATFAKLLSFFSAEPKWPSKSDLLGKISNIHKIKEIV